LAMILNSGEDFAREVKERWVGREVTVSKTTPAPLIKIKIEDARLTGWDEMDRRIQHKHGPDTKFFMVSGRFQDDQEKKNLDQYLIIALDGETVYDVRDSRLVVLTGQEVVQFSQGSN